MTSSVLKKSLNDDRAGRLVEYEMREKDSRFSAGRTDKN